VLREPTLERRAIATLTTSTAFRARPLRSAAVLAALTPAALLVITGAGAALRFARLGDVPGNPFYDAAVHTMSQSWHAFLFGALDPSGGVSVDKPPVDLWAQVASVKLLGFNPTALKLPQALAGTLSIPLLFDLVRRPFGRVAGLGAAAALAVLPIAVLTARSDTMDTLMAFLLLAAACLVLRAVASGRLGWLLGAGAVVGLAFNVKLFQALLPVPALALMWLVGSHVNLRRRLIGVAAASLVAVVVGLAWIVPVALTPLPQRPYPIGSANGSVWNLVFTFNGIDRLRGRPLTTPDTLPPGTKVSAQVARAQRRRSVHLSITGGPGRLLGRRYGGRIGSELLPALLIGAFMLIAFVLTRARRGLTLGTFALFGTWALTGAALFSLVRGFHPRYFETVSPAVAALLGAGLFVLAQRFGRSGRLAAAVAVASGAVYAGTVGFGVAVSTQAAHAELVVGLLAAALLAASALRRTVPSAATTSLAALALCALLIVPASASRMIVHTRAYDAERSGAMPHSWPPLINHYLRAHRRGTRYSFASIAPAKAAPLIASDPQPVLMLTSYRSRPLLTVAQLAREVRAGHVRYFLIGRRCTSALTRRTAACPATARWVIARGTDVTREVGLGHQRLLFRVDARQASAAGGRG
jgi:4-amino-4-deoxy-L-arabinose transferase-like glycosyltransferase